MYIFSQSGSVALIRCPTFKHEFTTNILAVTSVEYSIISLGTQWGTFSLYKHIHSRLYTNIILWGLQGLRNILVFLGFRS